MTPSRARAMLLTFFGAPSATMFDPDWPETMLQLSPGVSRDEVVLALRTKLARLEMHPHGSGPDVDELRAVLKGVAAQMMNGPGSPWTDDLEAEVFDQPALALADVLDAPEASRGSGEATPGGAEVPEDFEHHVMHAVTANPGPEGLRRALMVAALHGVSPDVVMSLVRGERTRSPGVEPEITATVHPPREWRSEEGFVGPDRNERGDARDKSLAKLWVSLAAVMLISVAGSAWLIVRAAGSAGRGPATPAPVQAAKQPAPPTVTSVPEIGAKPVSAERPAQSIVSEGPPNAAVFVRDIEAAAKAFDGSAAQVVTLKADVQTFMRWWPRLDMPARTAALESIVEAMFRCTSREAAEALLALVVPEALLDADKPVSERDVWPVTGGAGVLARLARERELPPPAVGAREAMIGKVFGTRRPGTSFAPGVEHAAGTIVMRLAGGDVSGLGPAEIAARAAAVEEAADRWWQAITAGVSGGLTGDEAERQSQLVALAGLERVLVTGPDLLESPVAFRFVSRVLSKMRYRPGDPSRARIVAWLGDARVSLGDAHAITQVLASRTGASGIDASMVLAPTATPMEREGVRAQVASAWELSSGGSQPGADADWLTGARATLTLSVTASSDIEHATAGALLAQFCRAAAMRARGEPVPGSLVTLPGLGLGAIATTNAGGPARGISTSLPSDGVWAVQYLVDSKANGAKVARLGELPGGQVGPVDAEVVAEAALTGSGELRAAAQAAAMRYASEPEMINGLLEALPRAPRSLRNAVFLSTMAQTSVISPSSTRWMLHYRRALVERLLAITAAQNPIAGMDQVASVYADAFAVMAGQPARDAAPEEAGPLAVRNAGELFEVWWLETARLSPSSPAPVALGEIRRRRSARLTVAQGVVQTFVAEQVACVEVLAAIVAGEKPARLDEVRSVIDTMEQSRRAAKTAAVQLRVTQEAMLRLWAIRLGEQL